MMTCSHAIDFRVEFSQVVSNLSVQVSLLSLQQQQQQQLSTVDRAMCTATTAISVNCEL